MDIRFSFSYSNEKVKKQLGIDIPYQLQTNYNIGADQAAYVIINQYPDKIQKFKWGLIPHNALNATRSSNMIIAMREGIVSKPSYRMPIRRQRCLVLADSYYLWKPVLRNKIPYRIFQEGKIMMMAGIWEVWQSPEGHNIPSFSIIGVPAKNDVSAIYKRMPLVLHEEMDQKRWLADATSLQDLELIMDKADNTPYSIHQIGDEINNLENNYPDLQKSVGNDGPLFKI